MLKLRGSLLYELVLINCLIVPTAKTPPLPRIHLLQVGTLELDMRQLEDRQTHLNNRILNFKREWWEGWQAVVSMGTRTRVA